MLDTNHTIGEYKLSSEDTSKMYVEAKDGTLQFIEELVEGQTAKQYTVEENKVIVTVEDNPSFKLIKKDAETGELLSNIKFAIYNVDNGEVPARSSKGEIIGTKEIINGREYYTVSTNEAGEITADLQEGLYKAVEVEAPDKYDINKSEYYFGIGASREGKTKIEAEWGKVIGGTNSDYIDSVTETSDGGYVLGGRFASSTIDLENGVVLNNKGSYDGMIIKYSSSGEVEWGKVIGGNSEDYIDSITETSDGGYVVVGYSYSTTIDLENGIILKNSGYYLSRIGMIIKYDADGKVKWAKEIGDENSNNKNKLTEVIELSDGGYIAVGSFSSTTIDLENEVVLNNNGSSDGMIIKYSSSGEVEWAKEVGGTSGDSLKKVVETTDGGYIAVGHFQSKTINLENEIVLNTSFHSAMIIKYDKERNAEWAKKIDGRSTGDSINSVIETSDGGYIIGGDFSRNTIDLGNGVVLKNNLSDGSFDGIIVKYDTLGEVEWGKVIGGTSSDYIESVSETSDGGYIIGGSFQSKTINLENGIVLNNNGPADGMIIKFNKVPVPEVVVKQAKEIGGGFRSDNINSIKKTKDGGYIVGGTFASATIDLGNGFILKNNGDTVSSSSTDGMIIKYDINENVEWIKVIGGTKSEYIRSVTETRDGGYLVGGYFTSKILNLGNGIILNNNSSYSDGMVIKYNREGEAEWAKKIEGTYHDYIETVTETGDGGIIAGGCFRSSKINLGNGIILNNSLTSNYDGMIIKYDAEGKIEWAKTIGSDDEDKVTSLIATSDGGHIVSAYSNGRKINLGNGIVLDNEVRSGLIIKYDAEGKVEWIKKIKGSMINTIAETENGSYIVGGSFRRNRRFWKWSDIRL